MRTIPDEVLSKMEAMRPHLLPLIDNIRAHPDRAVQLERAVAYAILSGTVSAPLTAQEVYYLAASSAGHPYGRYIDLDYAASLSGLSTAHLRRLCIAGEAGALKWRGEWYMDREQLPQRQRG